MFTKTTGWLVIPLWIIAMSWLVAHDVLPAWRAQDPPPFVASDWLKLHGKKTQYALRLDGERIGAIWTDYPVLDEGASQRRDLIWIDRCPIPTVAPLRIRVDSTFTGNGVLDELKVKISNRHGEIDLRGERFHSDFSFTLQSGPNERAFKLPLADGGFISERLQPFSHLGDLELGQSWRMQVFNPIAAVTGIGNRFSSVVVEVVDASVQQTPDGPLQCFLVQSDRMQAWIDEHGLVVRQEVDIPGIGTLRLARLKNHDTATANMIRSANASDFVKLAKDTSW